MKFNENPVGSNIKPEATPNVGIEEISDSEKRAIRNFENDLDSAARYGFKIKLEIETFSSAGKLKIADILSGTLLYHFHNENIDSLTRIINAFSLPESVIQSPEVQQAAKEGLVSCLVKWDIDTAVKIKDTFSLPESIIQSPEVQQAAMELLVSRLARGETDVAIKIKKTFSLPESIIQSPKVQQAALDVLVSRLAGGETNDAIKIKNTFSVSEAVMLFPEVQKALKDGVTSCIAKGDIDGLIKIKGTFSVSETVMLSPEVQKAIQKIVVARLKNGNINDAIKIMDTLSVWKSIDQFPEVQKVAEEMVVNYTTRGHIDEAVKIMDAFSISEAFILSPEVQNAARNILGIRIANERIDDAIRIKNTFRISEAVAQQVAEREMIPYLAEGSIYPAIKVINAFSVPEATIQSPEIQKVIIKGFIHLLARGEIDGSIKIRDTFSLSETVIQSPEVQQAAKKGLVSCFVWGFIDDAIKIKGTFSLSEAAVQQAAKEELVSCLASREIDDAIKIRDTFSLSEDVIQSPEVQQAVKEGLVSCFKNGYIEVAIKIKDTFQPSNETIRQIAQENPTLLLTQRGFFSTIDVIELTSNAYTQERGHIVKGNDPEVGLNFTALEEMLGAEKTKRLLLESPSFWGNPHDCLLFMGVLRSRSKEDQALLVRLVVQPLLTPGVDMSSFGESLSSFDVIKYIEEHGETPFRTLTDFERQTQMQKLNIHIPENASVKFEEAIRTLILAPGVDVPFIRKLIDAYEHANTSSKSETKIEDTDETYEENNWNDYTSPEFASTLINIIEGRDAIDERQVIRPWETEVSFDPLHRVLLAAAGIRGFNEQSPKLSDLLQSNEDLAFVINTFRIKDREKIEELKVRRDELKKKYPDKAGRYDAEFRTNIQKETVLKLGSADTVSALRIENRDSYTNTITPEEWNSLFTHVAEAIQKDPAVATSVEKVFATLTEESRREMVDSFVDVEAGFFLESLKHIRDIYDNTMREQAKSDVPQDKERGNVAVQETLQKVLTDETVNRPALIEFLLYIALNNREHLDTGKKVLGAVSSLFGSSEGKKKYAEQALAAGENNLAQAYLKGKVSLDTEDEQLLRDMYRTTVKTGSTRSLGIEIAKKSDPKGWVCGDYTNCCMPFTSEKNQEYLLREDMSYFLVSRNDASGDSELVGQSVLVYGEDEKQITVVIDNIEIANRSVARGEQVVIAKAYEELKKHLIDTYGDRSKRLKIVIGTSYNDDGGLVTGSCELQPVDAKPLYGDMRYSDWYSHSSNYVLYDSEAKEPVQKYYGLSIDAWEASRTRGYVARQFADRGERSDRERHIEDLLRKIGRGEDDEEGGLSFADNYSVALVRADKQVGYVIAADYLSSEEVDDFVYLEEMHLDKSLSEDEQRDIFERYLMDKKFKDNNNLDGLKVSKHFMEDNHFVLDVLRKTFTEMQEEKVGEDMVIRF